MVEFVGILSGFENMCFLMSFWLGKNQPKISKIGGFGREESVWMIFLKGSASRAVRRGGERGGVMLTESIQFRIQHAAPKVAADLKASPHAADLRK